MWTKSTNSSGAKGTFVTCGRTRSYRGPRFSLRLTMNMKKILQSTKWEKSFKKEMTTTDLLNDQITYHILKQCANISLTKWLINIFRVQTQFGLIYSVVKLGLVSYVHIYTGGLEHEGPNLKPIIFLRVSFKIISPLLLMRQWERSWRGHTHTYPSQRELQANRNSWK